MKVTQRLLAMSGMLMGLGFGSAGYAADVQTMVSVPAQLNGSINVNCYRPKGTDIILEGTMDLGSMDFVVICRNRHGNGNGNGNGNNKHAQTIEAEFGNTVRLIPAGGSIKIPKKPARGGVGSNPFVWVQFFDDQDQPLTEDIYLGRVSKGLHLSPHFLTEIVPSLSVDSADCEREDGTIQVRGNLIFSGVKARFTCKNKLKGKKILTRTTDLVLLAAGSVMQIDPREYGHKMGKNPEISVQFRQAGTPVTAEVYLGRCNEL